MRKFRSTKLFFRREDGYVTTEAVMWLPLIFVLFASLWLFFDAFRQHMISQKANYVIGDIISRETQPIDSAYIDGMQTLHQVMTKSLDRPGASIRVSVVRYDAFSDQYTLEWSDARGQRPLNQAIFDRQFRSAAPIVVHGDSLILVETWDNYVPVFNFENGLDIFDIQSVSFTSPRYSPQVVYQFSDGTTSLDFDLQAFSQASASTSATTSCTSNCNNVGGSVNTGGASLPENGRAASGDTLLVTSSVEGTESDFAFATNESGWGLISQSSDAGSNGTASGDVSVGTTDDGVFVDADQRSTGDGSTYSTFSVGSNGCDGDGSGQSTPTSSPDTTANDDFRERAGIDPNSSNTNSASASVTASSGPNGSTISGTTQTQGNGSVNISGTASSPSECADEPEGPPPATEPPTPTPMPPAPTPNL